MLILHVEILARHCAGGPYKQKGCKAKWAANHKETNPTFNMLGNGGYSYPLDWMSKPKLRSQDFAQAFEHSQEFRLQGVLLQHG